MATTKHETKKHDDRRSAHRDADDTPTAEFPTPARNRPDRKDTKPASQRGGRTIETPGQPGLEKEPNRDKAVGPGGQRMTSGTSAPVRDVEAPGVDKPDGINTIDPMGETRAEDEKLL